MEIPLEYAIGIDIGGTNTKFGIANRRGEILHTGEIGTKDYSDIHLFIDHLYRYYSRPL